LYRSDVRELEVIVQVTLWLTLIGGIFIGTLLIPGVTNGRMSKYLRELPRVGHVFGRLLEGIRMYRTRLGVIALTGVMSVLVHVMNTIGIYLMARGLPGEVPSLGAHFIIVSLAMVAGAVPLLPSGLGAFEGAMDFLYRVVPGGVVVMAGEGLLVAFVYRAITIAIALVGVVYYLRSRRDVDAAWAEAGHLDEDEILSADTEARSSQDQNAALPRRPRSEAYESNDRAAVEATEHQGGLARR